MNVVMARSQRGFTLIELMVVLIIITVLVTVALPAYQDSVRKSNRAAARGILMDIATRQEQYFINNKLYADSLDKLGYDVGESGLLYVDRQVEKSAAAQGDTLYSVEVVSLSTTTYSITALPLNFQVKDAACKGYSLDSEGIRGTTGSRPVSECW